MPIIDLAPPDPYAPIDRPKNFAVTPGATDVEQGSDAPNERPGWGATFSAAFRQDNTVGAFLSAEDRVIPTEKESGFNAWESIKGTKYEPHWNAFVEVRNSRAADAKRRQIDLEEQDRKTLHDAPWYQSVPAQIVAGGADLPTLLPGGAFVRGARGGFSVAKSAASTGLAAGASSLAQEAALQSIESTRPLSDSAVNVGASVFLGGLLGAGGAKLLSDLDWGKAVRAIDQDLVTGPRAAAVSADEVARAAMPEPRAGAAVDQGAAPASVGAAAAGPTSLESNAIAGTMASSLAAATAKLNPALRLIQSPSPATREVASQLFENSLYLKKNFEGIASQPAAETLMKEWNGGLASALSTLDESFSQHVKAGGQMSRREFYEAVGRAQRRGDADPDPVVAAAAKAGRAQVFDPLKDAAIAAKQLPEDVAPETAPSYFSRMWNRNKLIAREGEFKEIVRSYYASAIGNEYEKSSQSFTRRMARLDQEVADLGLPPEARQKTLADLETAAREHEASFPSLSEAADRLSEIRSETRAARQAGNEADVARLQKESETIYGSFPEGSLKAFAETRSNLRTRRRNVDLGAAGLQERSDRLLGQLGDIEEANSRAMERLVTKGQKLERDLDRLDADALEQRISDLAESYSKVARKADGSVERARLHIENINKRAAAKEAKNIDKGAEISAESDQHIQERVKQEALRQQKFAERMDLIAERLDIAKNLDHDGMMAEIKEAIDKATRETSAQSMARGERAARLGERMANLDPARVEKRVQAIGEMKQATERAFYDRWETRNLGEGVGTKAADFSAAAQEIADTVHATLTGRAGGGTRPEFMTVAARGPMKDRTFNIPDNLVEDFLEHDADLVWRRYVRIMGADVELANKFGSPDMKEPIAKVRADYARLRTGVDDEKQLMRLGAREKADVEDLEAVRDLLRGTKNQSPVERDYDKLTRAANHVNYIRSMGEVVLASLTDIVRPAMVHGLVPYMGNLAQLATNMKGIKASVAEAQLAGNVAERVLGHRLATISEIIDPYSSRGPTEAFLENMTNVASKWNGIRIWTDGMKSIASVMTQNRVLGNVADFAKVKPKERAYLAYLGIDQSMAERIGAQFAAHGEVMDGVRVAKTEAWTDPVAVRAYRAAINKDVDSIIVQKSVADVPLFASTPTGRMLLQFKSFALASHQKVLLRGLQEDKTRFVGGLVAMTALGMFMTWAKAVTGNRLEKLTEIDKNPGYWIAEGLDRSGVLSVPIEIANTFEKIAGFNPIKGPMKAFDEGKLESQKLQNRNELGQALGPTFGTVQDIGTVMGIPKKLIEGDDVTQGQKNAAQRLLPFNSYAGIRQMMNYLVNPPQ